MREEKWVFTEAGVHLMQGVHLICGPLNTGFTVCWKTVNFLLCVNLLYIKIFAIEFVRGVLNMLTAYLVIIVGLLD